MMSPPVERLYTLTEVSELLQMHVQTVRQLIKRDELSSIRVGPKGGSIRIRSDELARYIDSRGDL